MCSEPTGNAECNAKTAWCAIYNLLLKTYSDVLIYHNFLAVYFCFWRTEIVAKWGLPTCSCQHSLSLSKWEGTYRLRPNGWSALHTIAFWMLVNKHPCGTGPNGNTESAVVKGREVEVVGNDLLKHLSTQGYLLLLCFHLFSSLEWQPLGWEENRIL